MLLKDNFRHITKPFTFKESWSIVQGKQTLSLLSIPVIHVAVVVEVLVTGVGSSGTEVAVAFPAAV